VGKLQPWLPNFNQFSQNGVFGYGQLWLLLRLFGVRGFYFLFKLLEKLYVFVLCIREGQHVFFTLFLAGIECMYNVCTLCRQTLAPFQWAIGVDFTGATCFLWVKSLGLWAGT
jgi:hypothetical protein